MYNAHYMAKGYHPQVVCEKTCTLLDAWGPPGNNCADKDADQFLQRTFEHPETLGADVEVVVCDELNFAPSAFYKACASRSFYFIVRLKANKCLKMLGDQLIVVVPTDDEKDRAFYLKIDYQVPSW
ncbi:transposase [Lacticaseibacillus rhamnosus R0011]|nr:transposase [Lacticaseibacillus rhamnosus]EHJ21230.1 transposase [Lacticaseibacillus rhamnosus R0011]OXS98256.1 transposase [Lacticaseibacillus rhamnosus]PCL27010.1 transposase [Lacticaseibacillus rhamnosus]RIH68855.1 transposase [Lacticaseibacillus rhamnosus]